MKEALAATVVIAVLTSAACDREATAPAPSSASAADVTTVRAFLDAELGHAAPAATGGWSVDDAERLRVMLLALEMHPLWGADIAEPTGEWTPDLEDTLRRRLPLAEPAASEPLAAFLDALARLSAADQELQPEASAGG